MLKDERNKTLQSVKIKRSKMYSSLSGESLLERVGLVVGPKK